MKCLKNFVFCVVFFNIFFMLAELKEVCQDFCDLDVNDVSKNHSSKYCRYRNEIAHPEDLWRQMTCGYCYGYSFQSWFNENQRLPVKIQRYECFLYPYSTVNNKTITFDYENLDHLNIVRNSFKDEIYFKKFMDCCHNAVDCCKNIQTNENICSTPEYPCPNVWDAWNCYPAARNGTFEHVACPSYTTSSTEQECQLFSAKECFSNGTWNTQTDTALCSTVPIYIRRHTFHIYVLYVSTALMVPSIIIFAFLKKIYSLRVILHLNLIVMILLKNITTLLSKNLVIMDSLSENSNHVLNDSELPCKVLAVFDNIFKNAIFTSMFADGFYLHKMIVRILAPDPSRLFFILVIIVCSVTPSFIWMALMITHDKENCWMVDTDSWFQWITDGYKYVILIINTILFGDIIRVLIFKLKRNTNSSTLSAFKAALFLLPLFGVPLLVTSQREIFDKTDCTAGDIYYYITYVLEGLQGVSVAMIFCYFNKEVQQELKNVFRKFNLRIGEKVGWHKSKPRRRTTAMTNVRSSVAEIRQNNDNRPAMIVADEAFS